MGESPEFKILKVHKAPMANHLSHLMPSFYTGDQGYVLRQAIQCDYFSLLFSCKSIYKQWRWPTTFQQPEPSWNLDLIVHPFSLMAVKCLSLFGYPQLNLIRSFYLFEFVKTFPFFHRHLSFQGQNLGPGYSVILTIKKWYCNYYLFYLINYLLGYKVWTECHHRNNSEGMQLSTMNCH